MRSFDIAERRARLATRHGLVAGHRAADAVAATNAVVCLHATNPATVYLSAWARVEDMTREDLDRALYADRSLVKHLAMRRTLFVVPRDLLGVIQAAASNRVAGQESRRLARDVERAGLVTDGRAWLLAAQEATLRALESSGEATSTQLREQVALIQGSTVYAPEKSYGGSAPVAPRVLTTLSAAGHILRASNNGGWSVSRPNWATTRQWLGAEISRVAEADARAELVRRWLYAFGPATTADLNWWLGGTLATTRAALKDVGAVEVDLHGRPGVVLADDLDEVAPVAPWAALLPDLDPTTMGWFDRDWYLGPHRAQLFDTNGNAGPTAWWDGRIVGGWRQGAQGAVVVQLLEDIGNEGTAALQSEAARLTQWLGGARPLPRFPSPLYKSTT